MGALVIGAVVITQRDDGGGSTTSIQVDMQRRPTAAAGVDTVVAVGSEVQLDASQSIDPDGDKLAYAWRLDTLPDTSTAALSATDTASPTFTADVAGDYRLQLVVNDGTVDSDIDAVTIRAVVGTVAAQQTVGPQAGAQLTVAGETTAQVGATLDIGNEALAEDTLVAITTGGEQPEGLRFGQEPVGPIYDITPSGATFAEPARLTLPVPPGEDPTALRIGVWDAEAKRWQPLESTVDGDFVTARLTHLSQYALFYGGASTVSIANQQRADATDLPLTVTFVQGPVQDGDAATPVRGPLPAFTTELKRGEKVSLDLVPGRYHFVVSYPRPQPGVANSLWFTVPAIGAGVDDGVVDQTITIGDDGATSDNPATDSSIDFPGRTPVSSSNLRPVVDCSVVAPAGIVTTAPSPGVLGIPAVPGVTAADAAGVRMWQVGPIQVKQLETEGLTFKANLADPEGSALKYVWTWRSAEGISRDSGTSASGTSVERAWSSAGGFITRAGTYRVYLTAYDDRNLFSECLWTVTVVESASPFIDVVVDDRVIDFGRLDGARVSGVGQDAATVTNLCTYVNATSTVKTLPTRERLPGTQPHQDPSQYPPGMTCVYSLVADADIDPVTLIPDQLQARFVLPEPIYGRGSFYAAVAIPAPAPGSALAETPVPGFGTLGTVLPDGMLIGALIDTYPKMAAYNVYLSGLANAGLLPNQPHTGAAGPEAPIEPVPEGKTPKEFPYVVAFANGGANNAPPLAVGQVVTSTPNALGLVPTGEVIDVVLRGGSWQAGDATGYAVLMRVANGFADPRLTRTLAPLSVGATPVATITSIGQALPIVYEAPDDPNASGTMHDRRHEDEWTIARGGTVNIEARVTDGHSVEQREFGLVGFPTPWPRISVAKSVFKGHAGTCPGLEYLEVDPGTKITYCFVVTNESDSGVYLDSITLSDALAGITSVAQLDVVSGDLTAPLAPHDWVVLAFRTIADGEPGDRITNNVEVGARPVNGGGTALVDLINPTATDTATLVIPEKETEVSLTTEAEPPVSGPGSKSDPYVVWYAPKIGYAPIFITARSEFDDNTLSCNYPGGGIDCTIVLDKVMLLPGPFETYGDAVEAICSRLSNFHMMSPTGIYAGMSMGFYGGERHNISEIGGCPAKYWPPVTTG